MSLSYSLSHIGHKTWDPLTFASELTPEHQSALEEIDRFATVADCWQKSVVPCSRLENALRLQTDPLFECIFQDDELHQFTKIVDSELESAAIPTVVGI